MTPRYRPCQVLRHWLCGVFATLRLGVRIFFWESVDNPRDALFDERHLKVDEQAQTLVGEAKIRQQLFLVNWSEKFDGLHFHDHLVLDNHVGPKASVDADVFINYRNRLLANSPEAPASQLKCQDRIINGFEEAGTERGVNTKGGVDDFLGDGVLSHDIRLQFLAKDDGLLSRDCVRDKTLPLCVTRSVRRAGGLVQTPLRHVKPQGAWHGPKKWRNPKRAWVGQFKSYLLAIDGVEDVVFARYHLTIEKGQMYSWKNIQPAVVEGNRKGYRFFQCGLRLIDGRYGVAGRR